MLATGMSRRRLTGDREEMVIAHLWVTAVCLSSVLTQTAGSLVDMTGVTCTASSELPTYTCDKAFDGSEAPGTNEWASNRGGVGEWIQLNLPVTHVLVGVDIMQRCGRDEQNRELELVFSDGSYQMILLADTGGVDYSDCAPGADYQTFTLRPVVTDLIKIIIVSLYSQDNNGIRELEFWGQPSRPCDPNPCHHGGTCSVVDQAARCACREEFPGETCERALYVEDVASTSTCTASSQYSDDFRCERIFDGDLSWDADWASRSGGVGQWVQLDYQHDITVIEIDLLNRCHSEDQNSAVQFEMAGNYISQGDMTCYNQAAQGSCSAANTWQQYPIPEVTTHFIKVTIKDVCHTTNNGFREISVWSTWCECMATTISVSETG